ncbi:MAG: hypothetical protein JWQ95_1892 [Sphaerisporangium sp.]|nr:hypothetical protein [Sphaerisporangium sp.]
MDLSRVTWRKSSRSGNGANCVEIAHAADAYLVRDSKNAKGPNLSIAPAEWQAFIGGIKGGEFEPEALLCPPLRA